MLRLHSGRATSDTACPLPATDDEQRAPSTKTQRGPVRWPQNHDTMTWCRSKDKEEEPTRSASSYTAEAGRDPWIRRAVTGELPGPHALARYWSSPPLIRGSARALKTNGEPPASRGALIVRAPRKGPAGITPVLVISSVSSRRV